MDLATVDAAISKRADYITANLRQVVAQASRWQYAVTRRWTDSARNGCAQNNHYEILPEIAGTGPSNGTESS
jgi:hypothetical protein